MHQGCQAWGLACYFEAHAPHCPHLFSREGDEGMLSRIMREEEPHWMWEQRDVVSATGHCSHYLPNVADNAPWKFRHLGLLWWRSHILSFLMDPNAHLQRRLRQVKNLIGYTHPIIGLHIRHGDACTHATLSNYRPPCKSVSDYFDQVLYLSTILILARLPTPLPCPPRTAVSTFPCMRSCAQHLHCFRLLCMHSSVQCSGHGTCAGQS